MSVGVCSGSGSSGFRSLGAAVLAHRNDYGFDAADPPPLTDLPSVACVMPYHETGTLASHAASLLIACLRRYRDGARGRKPACRLIVVDDGSVLRPFQAPRGSCDIPLQVLRLERNAGRSAARNAGLRAAEAGGGRVTVFVDSDVLVPSEHITSLLRAARPSEQAIGAGFFTTVSTLDPSALQDALAGARLEHDWRWECVYQPSWIGCAPDLEYVGRRFRLLAETDGWRAWSGMVGPWCLANMVLGGCFAVPTELAVALGGFEESFDRYGFTETTLVAKLIAAGCMVVPALGSTAVHVEAQPAHMTQPERNLRFRDAHRRFFGEFLAASG
jgi:GT2 family glycosyltransferase